MKRLSTFTAILMSAPSFACVFCDKEVSQAMFQSLEFNNLLMLLVPFIVLMLIVYALAKFSDKRHLRLLELKTSGNIANSVPLSTAAIILGIGLGGFFDGIVFHQILQWHEMLSNQIRATNYVGKSVNMFWDGIFHGFCLLVVLAGCMKMWKILRRTDVNTSGLLFSGGLLFGWAVFNLVEGILNHHIFKLHNVMEFSENPDFGNYGFLGISLLILFIGWRMMAKAATGQCDAR